MKNLIPLFAGLLFGIGLAVSGMTDPEKVLAFLDITGAWDASLMFVMLAAIPTVLIGYRLIFKRSLPIHGDQFHLPTKKDIDFRLLLGATIFGAGWGLVGYCPGPAIASLAYLEPQIFMFVAAMLVGMFSASFFESRS